jgi:hypothetical protein
MSCLKFPDSISISEHSEKRKRQQFPKIRYFEVLSIFFFEKCLQFFQIGGGVTVQEGQK